MNYLLTFFLSILVFSTQAQNSSDKIIPYLELEEKPVFAGCEDNSNANCSTLLFAKYIQENFDKDIFSDSIDEVIIDFKFILGPEGKVKWHSVKADNYIFKNEAVRILDTLPLYRPGFQDGKPVNSLMRHAVKVVNDKNILTIEEIHTPPLNQSCLDSNEKKFCFSRWISNYINSNFNFKIVKKKLIPDHTYKSIANFIIDKSGNFIDIKIDTTHKIIESELIRLIKSLPQVKPAEVGGDAVAISYKLPVKFRFSK